MAAPASLKINNRFPDCVAVKLHFESNLNSDKRGLRAFLSSKPDVAGDINLSLTIFFNGEQEIEIPASKALGIPNGKAKFGIQKGKLSINFRECRILLESIELGKPFDIYHEVGRTQETGKEAEVKGSLPKPTLSGTSKETTKASQTSQDRDYQVSSSGFEENHSWIFEVKSKGPFLIGQLSQERLGLVQRNGQLSSIKAIFTALPESIALLEGQLGLTKNISRNKLAVIERLLILKYIGPLLQPYISEIEWNV